MSFWWWLSALIFVPTKVITRPCSILWGIFGVMWLLIAPQIGLIPDYTFYSWVKGILLPAGFWHILMGIFGFLPAQENPREYIRDDAEPYKIDLIGGVGVVITLLSIF